MVSQLENDSNYQNAEQVEAAIQKVIGSAPGVLDTLCLLYTSLSGISLTQIWKITNSTRNWVPMILRELRYEE